MCPLSRDDLKRIFEKLDENSDGVVSLDELNRLLEGVSGLRLSPAELESLAGEPALSLDRFLALYDSTVSSTSHDEDDDDDDLAKAFEVFDLNRDGFISSDELRSVLARLGLVGRGDCDAMIGAFDANSDGKLDFDEFKDMMLLTTTSS